MIRVWVAIVVGVLLVSVLVGAAVAGTPTSPAYAVNCITPWHASFVGTRATAREFVRDHIHQCWTIYYQPVPVGMK